MITVDTSALVAVLLKEPAAAACTDALDGDTNIKLSAGTYLESLIVAAGRGFADAMIELVDGLKADIIPVTSASAQRAAEAYRRWGRGFHPAALNFGDCFAYEVAASHGGRLLFVGDDFARTDIESVLDPSPRP